VNCAPDRLLNHSGLSTTESIERSKVVAAGFWSVTVKRTVRSLCEVIFDVPVGTYAVSVRYKRFTERGIFQFKLDGAVLGGNVDEYRSSADFWETTLGNVTFVACK